MSSFTEGSRLGIPIALGYFAVSFTFGIAAARGGISAWQAAFISLTNVTSAGQLAGLGIILASGSLWEMALSQFIINLRYSLMSLSISQKLSARTPLFHRFLMAFGMTDEIFAISAMQKNPLAPSFMYGAMALAIPGTIAYETTLTYLGLMDITKPSLGMLLSSARAIFPRASYTLLFPAIIVSIITITFYLVGNAFSDACDPRNHV